MTELQNALAKVVKLGDADALRNGQKLVSFAADLLPGQKRELNLLTVFVRCGGNTSLLDLMSSRAPDYECEKRKISLRMENDYGVSVENGEMVCDAFWQALGGKIAPSAKAADYAGTHWTAGTRQSSYSQPATGVGQSSAIEAQPTPVKLSPTWSAAAQSIPAQPTPTQSIPTWSAAVQSPPVQPTPVRPMKYREFAKQYIEDPKYRPILNAYNRASYMFFAAAIMSVIAYLVEGVIYDSDPVLLLTALVFAAAGFLLVFRFSILIIAPVLSTLCSYIYTVYSLNDAFYHIKMGTSFANFPYHLFIYGIVLCMATTTYISVLSYRNSLGRQYREYKRTSRLTIGLPMDIWKQREKEFRTWFLMFFILIIVFSTDIF